MTETPKKKSYFFALRLLFLLVVSSLGDSDDPRKDPGHLSPCTTSSAKRTRFTTTTAADLLGPSAHHAWLGVVM